MYSLLTTSLGLFGVLAQMTTASPIHENSTHTLTERAGGWAYFCDDAACSVNCGPWVSMSNPSCVKGLRKSFYTKEIGIYDFRLVVSPNSECSCQSDCINGISASNEKSCRDISHAKGEGGYKFIEDTHDHGKCDKNNCQ